MSNHVGPIAKTLYRRILTNTDPEKVQVRFAVAVLDRYRESGLAIKRTNTVGRLSGSNWTINFGIGEGEQTIHASLGDLFRLPEGERQHWAMHVAQADLSENYLKMLLHPGSCIDDGDTRNW